MPAKKEIIQENMPCVNHFFVLANYLKGLATVQSKIQRTTKVSTMELARKDHKIQKKSIQKLQAWVNYR